MEVPELAVWGAGTAPRGLKCSRTQTLTGITHLVMSHPAAPTPTLPRPPPPPLLPPGGTRTALRCGSGRRRPRREPGRRARWVNACACARVRVRACVCESAVLAL